MVLLLHSSDAQAKSEVRLFHWQGQNKSQMLRHPCIRMQHLEWSTPKFTPIVVKQLLTAMYS